MKLFHEVLLFRLGNCMDLAAFCSTAAASLAARALIPARHMRRHTSCSLNPHWAGLECRMVQQLLRSQCIHHHGGHFVGACCPISFLVVHIAAIMS